MDEILRLDPDTQRRLILQAAKELNADTFRELSTSQPTLDELRSEFNQNLWICIISGIFCFFPWLYLPFLIPPYVRLRSQLRNNWRQYQRQVDPECAHLVLVGDIRRQLGSLPRAERRRLKEVRAELERTASVWSDLQSRLERIRSAAGSARSEDLAQMRQSLALRLAKEEDAVTRSSLERQLDAMQGRQRAMEDMERWTTRLGAAQEECTQALMHLRSRIALLTATGGSQQAAAVAETAAALHTINASLTAAQEASEEVLRITV